MLPSLPFPIIDSINITVTRSSLRTTPDIPSS
jgi:hypothetical protein